MRVAGPNNRVRPRAVLSALLLAFGTVSAARAAPPDDGAIRVWVQGWFGAAVAEQGVPSAVVTVVHDGKVVEADSFGEADLARHIPASPDRTVYRAASVSKLFTWVAVMQLVEAGKLDLDRDVNSYLDFHLGNPAGRPVTLRHLMTHTAGFDEMFKDQSLRTPPPPLADMMHRHRPRFAYPPGDVISYSNYGAELAGYIVQRTSGEPYPDYIRNHIFLPLGMTSSSLGDPPPEAIEVRRAPGYMPGQRVPRPNDYGNGPAGSLMTTASDMSRFMLAMLGDGKLGTAQILSPASVHAMFQRQRRLLPSLNNGMALGFWVRDWNGVTVRGQSGRLLGYQADLVLLPDQHMGWFIASNGGGLNNAAMRMEDDFLVDMIAHFVKPAVPRHASPLSPAKARTQANAIAGVYLPTRWFHSGFLGLLSLLRPVIVNAGPNGEISISAFARNDDSLRSWVPIGPDLWSDDVDGSKLAALRSSNGAVVGFAADMVPVLQFERAPLLPWLRLTAIASLLVLAATAIAWPLGSLLARVYRAPARPVRPFLERSLHLAARLGACLCVASAVAWLMFVSGVMNDYTLASARSDALLTGLRIITILACIGGVCLTADAILAWRDPNRGIARRLWGLPAGLAGLGFVSLVCAFQLATFSLSY